MPKTVARRGLRTPLGSPARISSRQKSANSATGGRATNALLPATSSCARICFFFLFNAAPVGTLPLLLHGGIATRCAVHACVSTRMRLASGQLQAVALQCVATALRLAGNAQQPALQAQEWSRNKRLRQRASQFGRRHLLTAIARAVGRQRAGRSMRALRDR